MQKKARLDVNDIRNLQKYVSGLKKTLDKQAKEACEKAMDVGIQTAQAYLGNLDDLGNVGAIVQFNKEYEQLSNGYNATLVAYDSAPVIQTWMDKSGRTRSAELSAIDFYEFGSGAKNIYNEDLGNKLHPQHNVDRGSFPSETNTPYGNKNQANQPSWSWIDMNGNLQHSSGVSPTQPMYHAFNEMQNKRLEIAKESFKFE